MDRLASGRDDFLEDEHSNDTILANNVLENIGVKVVGLGSPLPRAHQPLQPLRRAVLDRLLRNCKRPTVTKIERGPLPKRPTSRGLIGAALFVFDLRHIRYDLIFLSLSCDVFRQHVKALPTSQE